jgi:hypothetical protein
MPEATVLYLVTAVVVVGLIIWVAAVLKTAKEPWARAVVPQPSGAPPAGEPEDDVPVVEPSKNPPVALASEGPAPAAEPIDEKKNEVEV